MGGLVSRFWASKQPGMLRTLSYTVCLIRGLKGFGGPSWRRRLLSTEVPSHLANVSFGQRVSEGARGERPLRGAWGHDAQQKLQPLADPRQEAAK